MSWLSIGLIALIISLLLAVLFFGQPRWWPRVRPLSLLALEVSGVVFASLVLITLAELATTPGAATQAPSNLIQMVALAARNSFFLLAAGTLWGTGTGLGVALALTWARRRFGPIGLLAALLWVLPTFLLAILVQEIQGAIYNTTNLALSGGYGEVSSLQIFWSALVLGIRPGAYVFRRARLMLAETAKEDFVRTATAKGLEWRQVVWRHILRPSLPIVITSWLISLRLLVGSLPLVEFFFGYPGLGQLFLNGLGLGRPGATINPDVAIAAVAVLATLFLLLETGAGLLRQSIDPRLREVRDGQTALA